MYDVLIVGAGPAGSVASLVLARRGARVLMLDRDRFPRPKLCGDSLNPGALALLDRLGLAGFPEHRAVRSAGMTVTGPGGVHIDAPYPSGIDGRFISRTDLDAWLLDQALAAGVEYQDRTRVVGAMVSDGEVKGVRVACSGNRECRVAARTTIAADGRRSVLAFGLGLASHPPRPRRWAIGAYFEGVAGLSSFGEMHIRAGHYIGVAPLPDGVANACVVTSTLDRLRGHGDLYAFLRAAISRDPMLGPRFDSARPIARPVALGPLAVDARRLGMPGLLLAGDASGFIDPMTGDGMYFAIRGGELAAEAAMLAIEGDGRSPHRWLAACHAREFQSKRRFNRALRTIVAQPAAVAFGSRLASVWPASIRRVVRIAADIDRSDAGQPARVSNR